MGDDSAAAERIWQQFFQRLARLVRTRLARRHRRVSDEEDVALSALNSFFRGVEQGRFARLDDRDDLWQLLAMLAERKLISQIRHNLAGKRGHGRVRGDSVFSRTGPGSSRSEELAASTPTPDFVAAFAEECRRLFELLDDPELRRVALLKSEGFTNEEIARELNRVPRTIERKLKTIRGLWKQQAPPDTTES